MSEMEYRSMFASLVPMRDEVNIARDWLSFFPVTLMMRALEGTLEQGTYEVLLADGTPVRFKAVEVKGE